MSRSRPPDELSAHDAAIWRAVAILQQQDRGMAHQIERCPTTFAPQLGGEEKVFAGDQFALLSYGAGGDGSYMHQGGGGFMAVGSGPMIAASLAASGMIALGRAAGNARRRAAAAQAAQVQWQVVDHGQLFVSSHGFYMHTPYGFHTWGWGSVRASEVVAPECVSVAGTSVSGPVHWVIRSPLAEMLFTQWARAVHPGHPQLSTHGWIPPGWVDRVRASRFDLPSFGTPQVEG